MSLFFLLSISSLNTYTLYIKVKSVDAFVFHTSYKEALFKRLPTMPHLFHDIALRIDNGDFRVNSLGFTFLLLFP